MPTVRKLSQDEVRSIENRGKGQRKLVEELYDTILDEYAVGDYGEADLEPGDNRLTVRNRLKAAALRRGLSLDFKRIKGNLLRFRVISADAQPAGSAAADSARAAGQSKGRRRKSA
jgi:hypothetical protein